MSQPILLLNCGSSSIKYQMIDANTEEVMAKGLVQMIGDPSNNATLLHQVDGQTFVIERPLPDHTRALVNVVGMFHEHGPRLEDAVAVAHRTVHGGTKFAHTTLITDEMIETLVELSPLAPLHNPPGIAGIRAARLVLPDVPHVAVFDTAFFADLPPEAYTYAIDTDLADKYGIRKYGFHGTSHQYVSETVADYLDAPNLKQIVCHLGNGASISAIRGGRPIETSMGMTPLGGLVMGTRSGDIDPGIHAYLHRTANMSLDDIDTMLNKRSGMYGLTGYTDMRDIAGQMNAGNADAQAAMDVYLHRLVFYIGAYHALLGGADTIAFTAGVGENDPEVRAGVCERLEGLGVRLDREANLDRSKPMRVISAPDSSITVLVVPTNEELAMVRQAARLLDERSKLV